MTKRARCLSVISSALNLSFGMVLVNLLWTTATAAQSNHISETNGDVAPLKKDTPQQDWQLEEPRKTALDLLSPEEKNITAQGNTDTPSQDKKQVDPFTKSSGGQLNIQLTEANSSTIFGFGTIIGYPDALNGPTRTALDVPQQETGLAVISAAAHLRQNLGANNGFLFEGIADPKRYGLDFRYGNSAPALPGAFAVNIYVSSARSPAYENGEEDVDLANGNVPWVNRFGGGLQYAQPLATNLDGSFGVNYQKVSIRDAAFTNNISPEDELGNSLTFSEDGQDTLLTLDAALLFETTDNSNEPTRGSRLRFGSSQSIPIGDAQIVYNRLATNFSQFIPLNLFGFTEGPRTLILNLQGGTFIGDVPSYQAFVLGGTQTIRGFEKGEVGTSRSFVKATAEYRFPIAALRILKQDVGLGGSLFVDYGNDLATADGVDGNPADAREKFGDGLGYGLGLSATSIIGRMRLEFGLNNEGGSLLHFTFGDRF
ncbi:outer membrane protein/protective antigen OMA87 [Xenococcus sp. PCC 7305]|uniref:BamA/TamA family outer membrane protein n=1 Tax=Xenococcus sp. PCC 7305 TaxID=102125 RepID=UPI0002ACAC94|nr:BamA/TamA family outer membrane protein [Xenococcus sp. PCC 7305]ELS03934.1 outer membrane protein/protective antigen OMA87 [Xenococcus sp. PCC 7305]